MRKSEYLYQHEFSKGETVDLPDCSDYTRG